MAADYAESDEPVRIPITDVFDLHSAPPRDVKAVVEAYLEEARNLGFKAVRIIHGRGIGVQREVVRAVLSRTDFVIDYRDAPRNGKLFSVEAGMRYTCSAGRHADPGSHPHGAAREAVAAAS